MASSKELFDISKKLIPGGVNSPVRSFSSVGGEPIYIESGKGPIITDVEDKEYIDFCASWGPLILGHAHPEVVNAIKESSEKGITFGTNCPNEPIMAELIVNAIPSIEKVRLTTSGTEATMTALRLARGYTKRNKMVKFEGCYHGHADAFLVNAGSGLLTNSISSSEGIPENAINDTIVVPFNDIESLKEVFNQYKEEIACVIVEPIAGNMGIIKPNDGYLESIREITKDNKSLLIFDEVITGFRLCYGGYQNLCKITPDLTTLGKIIGGGLPIGAIGGRKDIMDFLSPIGNVYQAGTLSGNPVALAAGIQTLEILKDSSIYDKLNIAINVFIDSIKDDILKAGYNYQAIGSMFCIYFQENVPKNLTDMQNCNIDRFNKYFHYLLENGIYCSPSQYETNFISIAHSNTTLEKASSIIRKCLSQI
ncbi:MAG: glutamate-1-semialdehyde-2,1-aminomutase [Planctomycetota bacterium]|nr:MAG: glutamate-1-semialdehyde-2,1-aminomutase [Planctomycetota bacterium]